MNFFERKYFQVSFFQFLISHFFLILSRFAGSGVCTCRSWECARVGSRSLQNRCASCFLRRCKVTARPLRFTNTALKIFKFCFKFQDSSFKCGHECHVSRVSLSNSECESPHNRYISIMSRKSLSLSKILNDTLDLMTLMTHADCLFFPRKVEWLCKKLQIILEPQRECCTFASKKRKAIRSQRQIQTETNVN